MPAKMDFPVITHGIYHTQNGNCYRLYDNGEWYKIECYLAAVPTQHGCTTYEEQFLKITGRLGQKLHPLRKSHSKPYVMKGDRLVAFINIK